MIRNSRVKLCIAAGAAAGFVAIALGVAAPTGTDAKAYFFVGGHAFGIGEQQVYVIDRSAELTVHYRDAAGTLRSKTYRHHAQRSVAMTIEAIASAGGPVLGVVTAAPAASGSATPSSERSPPSPPPSPVLDQQGAANPSGLMTDLAPASIILSGIVSELPAIGKPWKSSGEVMLPYGAIVVNFDNVVNQPDGNQGRSVVQIASTGKSEVNAKVGLAGFGTATLRGAGKALGMSFVESQNKLLLGMSLEAQSHGNANATRRRGSYDLKLKIAIKLVKYIPGMPVVNSGPAFVSASGFLGGVASPDTGINSTAVPDRVAVPAATDTGFIPPPTPEVTPYQSALPEVSLPPIPIPIASDQPVASPPQGPTPTPTPTRY